MAIKYEYYDSGDDDARMVYDTLWRAQAFTPDTDHTITPVKLLCYKVGSPGTITVGIRATLGGLPTGGDLCSGTTNGDTLTTSTAGEWREISLGAGYGLSASTQYAIVLRASDGNYSNRLMFRVDETSPTYTGGTDAWSFTSGASWTAVSGTDWIIIRTISPVDYTAS